MTNGHFFLDIDYTGSFKLTFNYVKVALYISVFHFLCLILYGLLTLACTQLVVLYYGDLMVFISVWEHYIKYNQ